MVVLRIRGHGDLGSTFLGVVSNYAERLRMQGGALLLSGVDPAVKERMVKSGHIAPIGEDRVFVAGAVIGESSEAAVAAGRRLLGQQVDAPRDEAGQEPTP